MLYIVQQVQSDSGRPNGPDVDMKLNRALVSIIPLLNFHVRMRRFMDISGAGHLATFIIHIY